MGDDALRDELDIQRVLYDYAWACDNGEWTLLSSVFTADAELDYSSTDGPAGGRDEVVGWLEESLSQVEMIQHVVSNFQIDISGDGAEGRAMFFTSVRIPGLEGVMLAGGYYRLRFARSSDGWKSGTSTRTTGGCDGCHQRKRSPAADTSRRIGAPRRGCPAYGG